MAVGRAAELLAEFPANPEPAPVPPPSLGAPSRADEVQAFSAVYAVSLADAIDRGQGDRVAKTMTAALGYADFVAGESVSSAVSAMAVSDRLCEAIRAMPKQMDAQIIEALRGSLEAASGKPIDLSMAIKAESARLKAWLEALKAKTGAEPIETVIAAIQKEAGRRGLSPEHRTALEAFLKKGSVDGKTVPAQVIAAEAQVAYDCASKMLEAAAAGKPAQVEFPMAADHPLASVYAAHIRMGLSSPAPVTKLRLENMALVELTLRLVQRIPPPPDLLEYGPMAQSPATLKPYRYKVGPDGFELLRPATEGGSQ
jgi:hypothetical protein